MLGTMFAYPAGNGSDHDMLILDQLHGYTTFADMQRYISASGRDTLIDDFGGGDGILLKGLAPAAR